MYNTPAHKDNHYTSPVPIESGQSLCNSHKVNYKKAFLALIIANIIWGAASPIFKWALQNIPPFSLAFLRFYYAGLILALILLVYRLIDKRSESLRLQIHRMVKSDGKNLLLLSLCGITFNITFFFLGLKISSAIDAPIIASAGPVFTFFLALIFLKEKFRLKKLLGMLLALFGVILIVIQPILEKSSDASVLGNLFFILATFGAVAQAIFGKKIYSNHNFILVTFLSFIIGTLTFIPMALYEYLKYPEWIAILDYRGLTGIIFGAVLSSTVAYTLFGYGLSKIQASEVAIFSYIDPIVAVLIAIPLLGEKITLAYILGSTLVLSGIYFAEKRIHYHPIIALFKNRLGGFIKL